MTPQRTPQISGARPSARSHWTADPGFDPGTASCPAESCATVLCAQKVGASSAVPEILVIVVVLSWWAADRRSVERLETPVGQWIRPLHPRCRHRPTVL